MFNALGALCELSWGSLGDPLGSLALEVLLGPSWGPSIRTEAGVSLSPPLGGRQLAFWCPRGVLGVARSQGHKKNPTLVYEALCAEIPVG
eukprot:6882360-Pyramimonas_sp.AAC.1